MTFIATIDFVLSSIASKTVANWPAPSSRTMLNDFIVFPSSLLGMISSFYLEIIVNFKFI